MEVARRWRWGISPGKRTRQDGAGGKATASCRTPQNNEVQGARALHRGLRARPNGFWVKANEFVEGRCNGYVVALTSRQAE